MPSDVRKCVEADGEGAVKKKKTHVRAVHRTTGNRAAAG